eukprot:Gb_31604 [translate_table: standard]
MYNSSSSFYHESFGTNNRLDGALTTHETIKRQKGPSSSLDQEGAKGDGNRRKELSPQKHRRRYSRGGYRKWFHSRTLSPTPSQAAKLIKAKLDKFLKAPPGRSSATRMELSGGCPQPFSTIGNSSRQNIWLRVSGPKHELTCGLTKSYGKHTQREPKLLARPFSSLPNQPFIASFCDLRPPPPGTTQPKCQPQLGQTLPLGFKAGGAKFMLRLLCIWNAGVRPRMTGCTSGDIGMHPGRTLVHPRVHPD